MRIFLRSMFVTFELKWVEGFLVESFHLSEHSIKSV